MAATHTVLILSDIHYASAAEKLRRDYEYQAIHNPVLRALVRLYRYGFWLRDPLAHNARLDPVLATRVEPDLVVANGDFSCDSAFVGVSDDAAFQSVQECLGRLRQRFGDRLQPVFGDHELGKLSLFGGQGGLRLASWQRATTGLGLAPFWQADLGVYRLMGVVSSLIALPVFEPETLPEERADWRGLREAHLEKIRQAFRALEPDRRVLLFCHDPTALPFLWQEATVRARLDQVEATVIGHLHSRLIFWKSGLLAGMPVVRCLGNAVRRMSTALHDARCWRPFKVRLCPSLAGIQLLKDGGYYVLTLDPTGQSPAQFAFQRCRW